MRGWSPSKPVSMNCSLRIKLLIALLLTALAAGAQTRHWARVSDEAHSIQGRQGEITLNVTVDDGYHIQAHQPADPALIPTLLTVEWPAGFRGEDPVFPETHPFVLAGSTAVLQVYSETFVVKIPLSLEAKVAPGEYEIPAMLSYQACDDRRCLFPRDLSFALRLTVL